MIINDLGMLEYNIKEKQGNPALITWINGEYKLFQIWLQQSNKVLPLPSLQISSSGKRANKSGKFVGAHGVNKAVDISRTITSSDIQKAYVMLFGLWLQKKNTIAHVSISSWNIHIHVDSLSERSGKNTMEIKIAEDSYDFKPIDYDFLYLHYSVTKKGMPDHTQPLYLLCEALRTGKDQSFLDPFTDTVKGVGDTLKTVFTIALGLFVLTLFKKGK